jgi:hypothetical protein
MIINYRLGVEIKKKSRSLVMNYNMVKLTVLDITFVLGRVESHFPMSHSPKTFNFCTLKIKNSPKFRYNCKPILNIISGFSVQFRVASYYFCLKQTITTGSCMTLNSWSAIYRIRVGVTRVVLNTEKFLSPLFSGFDVKPGEKWSPGVVGFVQHCG